MNTFDSFRETVTLGGVQRHFGTKALLDAKGCLAMMRSYSCNDLWRWCLRVGRVFFCLLGILHDSGESKALELQVVVRTHALTLQTSSPCHMFPTSTSQ